jgi:hypothetical protein
MQFGDLASEQDPASVNMPRDRHAHYFLHCLLDDGVLRHGNECV